MKNSRPFPKPKLQSAPKTVLAAGAAQSGKTTSPTPQSKDVHEDRGTRQMKTSHNPQTLPHRR